MTLAEYFSPKYAIEDVLKKGKGCVAKEKIPAGELLVKETPFERALKDTADKALVMNHLLQSVHGTVMRDPATRDEVYSLYPSKEISDREFDKKAPSPEKEEDDPFPDALVEDLNHLYNIITCNTFLVDDHDSPGGTALSDIAKGEELTISYCSEYRSRQDRREHLRRIYHFTCGCPRCAELGLFDVTLDALRCENKLCDYYLTTDKAGVTRCTGCGATKSASWVASVRKDIERKVSNDPLNPNVLDALHPRSEDAFAFYARVVAAAFKDKKQVAERAPDGLACGKKMVACLQGAGVNPEELLHTVVRCAVLSRNVAERDALWNKARELCVKYRGSPDVALFFPLLWTPAVRAKE
eukprot:gene3981-6173_t